MQVVGPLRKPLDDVFMQSINGRALSCDFCPAGQQVQDLSSKKCDS